MQSISENTDCMVRLFCSVSLFLLPGFLLVSKVRTLPDTDLPVATEVKADADSWLSLYEDLKLDSLVSRRAFRQAIAGFKKIENRKKDILTLIDFSKPSTEKRLFVIDMGRRKLLYASLVAHGRNSGEKYATSFSNQNGSYKSSLGFYLTSETYQGSNGYSLRLDGLEKGINDKARERAIVMHGAAYANPAVTRSGRLGRSFGCPAIPQALTRPIIDTIKGGSVLFIYAPQQEYLAKSSILDETDLFPAFSGIEI